MLKKNYMFEVINKITGSVYKKNIPTAEEAIVCLNDARKDFKGVINNDLWEIRKMKSHTD